MPCNRFELGKYQREYIVVKFHSCVGEKSLIKPPAYLMATSDTGDWNVMMNVSNIKYDGLNINKDLQKKRIKWGLSEDSIDVYVFKVKSFRQLEPLKEIYWNIELGMVRYYTSDGNIFEMQY